MRDRIFTYFYSAFSFKNLTMKIIKDTITISELKELCEKGFFVNVLKAVVDIDKKVVAVDAEVHAELMEFLIKEEQSEPKNVWGINLVPSEEDEKFIVFDSLINLKPGLGNRTRGVESPEIRQKITDIINVLVKK